MTSSGRISTSFTPLMGMPTLTLRLAQLVQRVHLERTFVRRRCTLELIFCLILVSILVSILGLILRSSTPKTTKSMSNVVRLSGAWRHYFEGPQFH